MEGPSFFKENFAITKLIQESYYQVKSEIDHKKYIAIVKDLAPAEEFFDLVKYLDHPFFNKLQCILKSDRNHFIYLTDYQPTNILEQIARGEMNVETYQWQMVAAKILL